MSVTVTWGKASACIVLVMTLMMLTGCGDTSAPSQPTRSPKAASPTPVALPGLSCADVRSPLRILVADLRRQGNLGRQIGSNWSAATKADIFGGAWILYGTYVDDMQSFNQTVTVFYQGTSEVASDAGLINESWQQMRSAPTTGNGRVSIEEWQVFQVNILQLAALCNDPGKRAVASLRSDINLDS
jgi:hypothetical protein